MQCVCGAAGVAAAPTRPQHQRPHPARCYKLKTKFFREVRPLSRLLRPKSPYGAGCCASPEQHFKTAGKIWCGQILPNSKRNVSLKNEKSKIATLKSPRLSFFLI